MSPENDSRPDPEALLAVAREEERSAKTGRLRIFLGAAPGVGKTYAMLEAAQQKKKEGLEVVAGIVETHGRQDTQTLLEGLEMLPRKSSEYRGITIEEFDLDGVLARSPRLVLVDELAHSNAPGSRHPKRWQDVKELLEREIDVYTTLNIQHIESRTDLVTQITGITVRETVPDSILELADSIILVDLPPDDLLVRLKEGKVYIPQYAARAVDNFFRPGNLNALRELALRLTADRVNTQVLIHRRSQAGTVTWPTVDRLLVCVGPAPSSAKVVRTAKRLADHLHAPWLAVAVETPTLLALPDQDRNRLTENLRLAESLGAETLTVGGQNVAEEVLRTARSRNVSKIVLGKPLRTKLKERIWGTYVDQILRLSQEIDVYVIKGEGGGPAPAPTPAGPAAPARESARGTYLHGLALVGVCTLVAALMYPRFELSNLIMIYLLGVVLSATTWGRGPAVLSSVASVAAFDFFFVPPRFTFSVSDTQYFVTFGVMLLVALVISHLTAQMRHQARMARMHQERAEALHALSRDLASTRATDRLIAAAKSHLAAVLGGTLYGLLPDRNQSLFHPANQIPGEGLERKSLSVAQWAFNMAQPAGWSTQNLPAEPLLFIPLNGLKGPVGVLGLRPANPARLPTPEQMRLLEAMAKQVALALEVDHFEESSRMAQLEAEKEKMRSALLSSVTHDFQTPLAAITGSASSLLQLNGLTPADVRDLTQNIHDEADRLSRLINNYLRMTRLEAGAVRPNLELYPFEEIVGAVVNRLEKKFDKRRVEIDLPSDLPLVPMDGIMIEQVLINLLENAHKYSPVDRPVSISARVEGDELAVLVADRGPGLALHEEEKIFDLFYRGDSYTADKGHGLGLAICRAIIKTHGGRIEAANRASGGSVFRFFLPLKSDLATGKPAGNPG